MRYIFYIWLILMIIGYIFKIYFLVKTLGIIGIIWFIISFITMEYWAEEDDLSDEYMIR